MSGNRAVGAADISPALQRWVGVVKLVSPVGAMQL